MEGQFAGITLRRDSYLVGSSIDIHDLYLHTQDA